MKHRVIQLPSIVQYGTNFESFEISSEEYDLDGINEDIQDAVNDAMPEGIYIETWIPEAIIDHGVELPEGFLTTSYWRDLLSGIDMWAIVQEHARQ